MGPARELLGVAQVRSLLPRYSWGGVCVVCSSFAMCSLVGGGGRCSCMSSTTAGVRDGPRRWSLVHKTSDDAPRSPRTARNEALAGSDRILLIVILVVRIDQCRTVYGLSYGVCEPLCGRNYCLLVVRCLSLLASSLIVHGGAVWSILFIHTVDSVFYLSWGTHSFVFQPMSRACSLGMYA